MTSEYSQLENYIGVKHVTNDVITASQVHRLNLTLNRINPYPRDGDPVPWGWHFIFFPRLIHTQNLSPDGLSAEFEGCPDSPLPKRMFVGNDLKFYEPLQIGDAATKEIYIKSVTPKNGRSGKLIFVTFAITIMGPRGLVLEDEHMMVFKDEENIGTSTLTSIDNSNIKSAPWQQMITLNEVTLFRYSAVTFNPHRIHYDQPYTHLTEKYPALVVQGGLTSILLLELLARNWKGKTMHLKGYKMRAKGPLLANQPIMLAGRPSEDHQTCQLWALDHLGNLAMEIVASF